MHSEELRTALDALAPGDAAERADVSAFVRSYPREFLDEISPDETMYKDGEAASYFAAGRAALRCIRLAMLQSGREGFTDILDFGCAFGRVLRMLKAAFPEARLTASDLRRDGVDFCARTFGATPVYSSHDPAEIELEGPFDLIWCGSVFTHFSRDAWGAFLPFLERLLAPRGLLVFTTLGRYGVQPLRGGKAQWGVSAEGVKQMVADYDRSGFGFGPHMARGRPDLGVSLAKPSWVHAQIEKLPTLRLVAYTEAGWGRQDTVACMQGPFEASPPR